MCLNSSKQRSSGRQLTVIEQEATNNLHTMNTMMIVTIGNDHKLFDLWGEMSDQQKLQRAQQKLVFRKAEP